MAQPPKLPEFDKAKFAEQPLFAAFWEMLQPHLKLNARAMDRGVTVGENVAGAWVDVDVSAGQMFPIRVQNPLAAGQTPYGVLCVSVLSPSSPGTAILGASAVQPDWVSEEGAIVIRKFTGELSPAPFRARLLVLAQ